jgi:hypothetical protein
MTGQPNPSVQSNTSNSTDLQKQIDKLSAENLVLLARQEFHDLLASDREKSAQQFKEHKDKVDGEINKRLIGMSVLALVVAALAWWSAIQPIRKLVSERLDKEFATENHCCPN